ncbi:hypothetical protein T09_7886 [Trichinella sp. T9]|nr:hypothetical protein T09_7886 [Trichinella sp. T9]
MWHHYVTAMLVIGRFYWCDIVFNSDIDDECYDVVCLGTRKLKESQKSACRSSSLLGRSEIRSLHSRDGKCKTCLRKENSAPLHISIINY